MTGSSTENSAMQADWRHYAGAALVLVAVLALLWWWNFGKGTPLPTAPAPPGSNPVMETPPEKPVIAN